MYLCACFAVQWVGWMLFEKPGVSLLYKAFIIEMSIAVLINVVLNFYWAYLILMGVVRIFKNPKQEESFSGTEGDGEKKSNDLEETTNK